MEKRNTKWSASTTQEYFYANYSTMLNGRVMMKEAGNRQPMWMGFKQSISSIQNNLANPDRQPRRNSACGGGATVTVVSSEDRRKSDDQRFV
jgi:hypothetical protein